MANSILNPHYGFSNAENKAEITKIKKYNHAYEAADYAVLDDFEESALQGKQSYSVGLSVKSPWGENKVLEAHIGTLEANQDTVVKEIIVNPGFMLSLQKHRGRKESWAVKNGILTIIYDGQLLTLSANEEITLPKGSIHCMINRHDAPVTVIETQEGFCREADNIRLLDFNNRPTIPLSNKIEALSAILYAQIHQEICEKFGCQSAPNPALMAPEFKELVENLEE